MKGARSASRCWPAWWVEANSSAARVMGSSSTKEGKSGTAHGLAEPVPACTVIYNSATATSARAQAVERDRHHALALLVAGVGRGDHAGDHARHVVERDV